MLPLTAPFDSNVIHDICGRPSLLVRHLEVGLLWCCHHGGLNATVVNDKVPNRVDAAEVVLDAGAKSDRLTGNMLLSHGDYTVGVPRGQWSHPAHGMTKFSRQKTLHDISRLHL